MDRDLSLFCLLTTHSSSINMKETRKRATESPRRAYRRPSAWSAVYISSLTALLLAVTSLLMHAPQVASAAPATKIDMHAGHQLTPDTFQETIRDGIW